MPPSPPAQAVQDFREPDSEDPGLQCRFALEATNISKDFQEDFLNGIRSLRRISEHAVGDMEKRSTISPNKLVVGCILVGLQAGNEQRFFGAEPLYPIHPAIGDLSRH